MCMTKPELYNKKSKSELKRILEKETFERLTCSFYRYVRIEKPKDLRNLLYTEFKDLDILGRIYIAKEGINAQISVPKHNWDKFVDQLHSIKEFNNMEFKIALENKNDSFLKLIIKVKAQIVADGLPDNEYDLSNIGNYLSAKEFNESIDQENTILVDVRNQYESEVGHFEGAICPDVDTFKDSLPIIKKMLKGHENDKILLYCTGGIRCEKTSAYLKNNKFQDVNQLKGGIISYAHEVKSKNIKSKFVGKNFVFDNRMGERITSDVISKCHQCRESSDSHTNCKNQSCHILFIQCQKCNEKFQGCCSFECADIANLPIEEQRLLRKNNKLKKTTFKNRLRPKIKTVNKN